MIATRKIRRMFQHVIRADAPAPLDVEGIDAMDAISIIRRLSAIDAIRVCDGPDPLKSLYILTSSGESFFRPKWWHWFF